MIEARTYEDLLNQMLGRVPSSVDKREGSIIYDALAPAAAELAQAYLQLHYLDTITYADMAVGEYLTLRCRERGIDRRPATQAIRKATFNVEVPLGSRFMLDETTYIVESHQDGFNYTLRCEQYGRIGNRYEGDLLPLSSIQGLSLATLSDIVVPGQDVEDDDSLRSRYLNSLDNESYGGNISDYKDKTKALPGVGDVRVKPVWNGGGTVKLIIIDSEFNFANPSLVEKVQLAIDPVEHHGEGVGIAPIGHTVTVESANKVNIDISSSYVLQPEVTWEDVKPLITKSYEKYLLSLRKSWSENSIVVRTSYLDTLALSTHGVVDVGGTTINGESKNLIILDDGIPILGEVTNSP